MGRWVQIVCRCARLCVAPGGSPDPLDVGPYPHSSWALGTTFYMPQMVDQEQQRPCFCDTHRDVHLGYH
ncbi:unnamed protein product [Gadus morhua 'NCC']